MLKHKPNKKDEPTTTDFIEEAQKLSDAWFEKGLPERPEDKTKKKEDTETESTGDSKIFIHE